MDRRFAADEWITLPNAERAKRCQLMAEEALKLAKEASSPAVADDYLRLAEQWLRLATDLLTEAEASVLT